MGQRIPAVLFQCFCVESLSFLHLILLLQNHGQILRNLAHFHVLRAKALFVGVDNLATELLAREAALFVIDAG